MRNAPRLDMSARSARQRARGEIRVEFARAGERSEAARAFETGGLRLRFPHAGVECEAVIVNTGGGMAGGDLARMTLDVGAGARALATTQSAEKIYKADGETSRMEIALSVAAGGSLVWAPQETILFEGARLQRRLEAEVAADASLLMVEAAVFGRLAHGETEADAGLRDDWRIRRAGKLIFAEAARIENAGARLERPAAGACARALATLLYVAPDAQDRLEPLRAALEAEIDTEGGRLEAGVSLVDGFLVARLLSPAPPRLRAAILAGMRALRGRGAPRVWF